MIANEKQTQIQKSEGLILRGSHLLSNSLVPMQARSLGTRLLSKAA